MKIERVSHWVEILANVGVIVTLLLLVTEVRGNTLALQRQTRLDRADAMNAAFLERAVMPTILAEIKAIDTWDGNPFEVAFVERYQVPIEHAIVWARYLMVVWSGLEGDYVLDGESPDLARRVQLLLSFPDNRLLWEHNARLFGEDFQVYVERVSRR
jgi:hypothetical protein